MDTALSGPLISCWLDRQGSWNDRPGAPSLVVSEQSSIFPVPGIEAAATRHTVTKQLGAS